MNKVILMGRLVRDPEVRYMQNENSTAVAKFSFAVPRKFKRDNEPDCNFINCVAFGKTAEFIEKYAFKGIKLLLEGRWQTGSYMNKDGVKVYTNDCVVESCEFAESKNTSQQNTQSRPEPMPQTDSEGFMTIPPDMEDELPFN